MLSPVISSSAPPDYTAVATERIGMDERARSTSFRIIPGFALPSEGVRRLMGCSLEIDRRIDAFLWANYADEIAILMQTGPVYLAITRHVVEDSEGIAAPTT